MYNILIAQFRHETNTFNEEACTLQCYKDRNLLFGGDIIPFFSGVKTELGAFIEYFGKVDDVRLIPAVAADAMPCGRVTREVYEIVRDSILDALRNNRVDALLLALHGAMVLDFDEDGEGLLLEELRATIGNGTPVFVVLDLHANITEKMARHADALFPYDCYPHTDAFDRGIEASACLYKTLRKEMSPVLRFRKLPILIPLLASADEPKKSIFVKVHEYEKKDRVISISVVDGFFLADIREAGMSVLAQTDGDEKLAEDLVELFSSEVMRARALLVKKAFSLEEAIETAMSVEGGPVVFGDIADNPGGGSPGDGTWILRGLLEAKVQDAAIAHFYDPATVARAIEAGVGNNLRVQLGGRFYKILGNPVECDAYVKCITDGVYYNKDAMFKGLKNRIGRTVVLVVGGVEIIVSERRHQAFDVEIFRANGIEPTEKKILVVKSSLHFRGSYGRIAKKIIDVNVPGLTPANPGMLAFKNVRRPVFPLDEI
jgi:microcystin degradation protein MlrC